MDQLIGDYVFVALTLILPLQLGFQETITLPFELILRDVLLLDIFSLINVHLRNFPIENQSRSNFYFENVLLFVGACTQHHHLQKW